MVDDAAAGGPTDPDAPLPDELALMALAAGSGPPLPPRLRERVLGSAREAPFTFVAASGGIWLDVPGGATQARWLLHDGADRMTTRLLRFSTDGDLPPSPRSGARALLVVQGRLVHDGGALDAGAFRDGVDAAAGWRGDGGTVVLEFAESGATTVPRDAGHPRDWRDVCPGVRSMRLAGTGDGYRDFDRVVAAPGAVLPGHPHAGMEELFVEHGSCVVEGRALGPGDYHRAAGGTRHAATVAGAGGCSLLVATRAPATPATP